MDCDIPHIIHYCWFGGKPKPPLAEKCIASWTHCCPDYKIIRWNEDNVDLAAATAHNVCVMNTPGQNSNAVAELALGLMVYAVRNLYNGTSGCELKGKKLGIHAYGNVGRNVARIAKGFGMDIYAYDAYCPNEVMEAEGVTILTCGTCLDFYGMKEKLAVGSVTNMYDIVERMENAAQIIKP